MDKQHEVTIHKIWRFIKYDVVKKNLNNGAAIDFKGENFTFLDITNSDSLRFVIKDQNKPIEAISYKIVDSVIFMEPKNNPKIGFKIWKLTSKELILLITLPNTFKEPDDNAMVMIFESK